MLTDPRKPIGFRRTIKFGWGSTPWRFWIGPLLVTGSRRPNEKPAAPPARGWVQLETIRIVWNPKRRKHERA